MEPTQPIAPPPGSRRAFLRRLVRGGAALAGVAGLGVGYGFWEASQVRVVHQTITLPRLPPGFEGTTVGVLADFHHGPFVGIDFIRRAVGLAQALAADAYVLVGDFAHKGTHAAEQLPPCLDAVSRLRAPLGVYAVPGNHDMPGGGQVYRAAIGQTPLTDLTNRAVRLAVGSDALWLAGVDDLWWGRPDLAAALREVPRGEEVVLLAHNPDFAEIRPDPRVGLVVSGHMHGGQAYLPGLGAAWAPSQFGDKYLAGLVRGPASQVFVTRGLGEAGVPLRFNCPRRSTCSPSRPAGRRPIRPAPAAANPVAAPDLFFNVEVVPMRALFAVVVLPVLLCIPLAFADEDQPPAEKPAARAAAAGDLLRAVRDRIVIEEQRLAEIVKANVRKARCGYPDNSDAALKVLRDTLLQVWDHPDISERTRDDLLGQLLTARKELVREPAPDGGK